MLKNRVQFIFESLCLDFGEVGVNELRNGHFVDPVKKAGCREVL